MSNNDPRISQTEQQYGAHVIAIKELENGALRLRLDNGNTVIAPPAEEQTVRQIQVDLPPTGDVIDLSNGVNKTEATLAAKALAQRKQSKKGKSK